MFHLLSWGQNLNPAGSMVALTAAREAVILTVDTFHKVSPRFPYLIGTAALINTPNASRAQLRSPSLIADGGYDIEPIVTANVFSAPAEVTLFPESPLYLEPEEQLEAWVESTPGVGVRHYVHAWVADGVVSPVYEEMFSVRATAAIQQVNFNWVSGNMTLDEPLPQGLFIVLGMRCRSDSGQMARLIFRDQFARPGAPIIEAVTGADDQRYRFGHLGVWGFFNTLDLPLLEIYHGTAASQVVILDLARF